MKCPHCLIAFHDEDLWERYEIETPEESAATWVCLAAVCPSCKSPIIKLVKEALGSFEVIDKRVIYPASPQRVRLLTLRSRRPKAGLPRGLSSLALERKGVSGVVPPCFASHTD